MKMKNKAITLAVLVFGLILLAAFALMTMPVVTELAAAMLVWSG
jgi:hypothetical protein